MNSMIIEWSERADVCTKEGQQRFHEALGRGVKFHPVSSRGAGGPRRGRRRKHSRAVAKIDAAMGAKMRRMREEGVTLREIARTTGLSLSGAGNYLRRTARGIA